MTYINLESAAALTGLSRRTLWRRIADGSLTATQGRSRSGQDKKLVLLADVLDLSPLRFSDDDLALIAAADQSQADAQCELALMTQAQGYPQEGIYWLEQAAQQFYPEAMYWLGRAYLAAHGVPYDHIQGCHWLDRAARHGHASARHALEYLHKTVPLPDTPAELDAALDELERSYVLAVLNDCPAS